MKKQMQIYYDKEGDFLEINWGNSKIGQFKNLGKGVFERVDDKTGGVLGIAIAGFKKRAEKNRDFKISLPSRIQI